MSKLQQKILAHLLAIVPLAFLDLGFDAVEALTNFTGQMAIYLAIASLAITPIRLAFGNVGVFMMRRPLGLWAFAYAVAHLATYLVLDLNVEDLLTLPFLIGYTIILMWLPMAVTSNRWGMKKLKKNWKKLHKLAYPAAILAVIHWMISVKVVPVIAIAMAILLTTLLIWRKFK